MNSLEVPMSGSSTPALLHAGASDVVLGQRERINFYGVPISLGSGGSLVPKKERFKDDVITSFDGKMMRDIAIALDLGHPLLIEGGADLGKTQAIDRVCAYTDREVYFVNCRDIEAEMLIGRMTAVEGTKSGFGWKDGIVLQAIRNGGVLVLDEYNRLKGEARAAFHQVYDAVLRNKGEVVLTENNGEVVPLHPNFRIAMTQNPPDGTYTNREVIDPAELSRIVHLRYPAQLPAEVEEARILGSFGIAAVTPYAQDEEVLPYQPALSKEDLAHVPGMAEVLTKFVEFHRHLRAAVANRELGADTAQPIHLTFQRDVKRLFTFVSHYYNGDLNETIQRAIDYYFVNRFESEIDRQKVREAGRMVEGASAVKSKRRSVRERLTAEQVAEVEGLLGKNFFGPLVCQRFFKTAQLGVVPPIPSWITPEFLKSKCMLSPEEKTIAQSHSLVFIPSHVGNIETSVAGFARLANEYSQKTTGKRIMLDSAWFDIEPLRTPSSEGIWVLLYNGACSDSEMRGKYRGVDTRELILSKAIMMLRAKGDLTSLAQCSVEHNAEIATDIGLFYAAIKPDRFRCGYIKNGSRKYPLLLARIPE